MTTKPKTRKAPAAKQAASKTGAKAAPAGIRDPEFALIDAHKARTKEWCRLYNKLDVTQFQAEETHGRRPSQLIAWRNYEAIWKYEIDNAREELLRQPGADRKQIRKE
jgi:hypothetical protein